jgi:hypothetical protein
MTKFHSLFFIISVVTLTSCAHVNVSDKILVSKHDSDLVSVEAAINLARVSYIKGCKDKSLESKIPVSFEDCLKKANTYLKDDVIFIIDQDGKTDKAKENL